MRTNIPVADALLGLITTRLGPGPAPRVRAIHLPPVPWTGTKAGEFAAVELDSGAIGLSYVLLDDTLAALAGGDGGRGRRWPPNGIGAPPRLRRWRRPGWPAPPGCWSASG